MKMLGYYNGKFGPLEEMTVPMNDRACWFGDGVYDAGVAVNYHMIFLNEHIDRFFHSAEMLEIEVPVSKQELYDLLYELIRHLDTGNLLFYFQVTRGTGVRNHLFPEGAANLWITFKPLELVGDPTPIRLITWEDTRFFHCNIKTLNLIPSVIASQRAKEAGCFETVLYRPGGRITEGSHSNIHIMKDGALITAPADNMILPGIARAHMIRACHTLGIPVREEAYTLEDLFSADEVLLSMSSHPCCHADFVDGKAVGMKDGKTYELLRQYLIAECLNDAE